MQGILGLVVKSGCGETRGESKWVRNRLTEGGPQNLAQSQNGSQNGSTKSRGGPQVSKLGFKKSCGCQKRRLNVSSRFRRWGTMTGPRTGPPFLADRRGRASIRHYLRGSLRQG